MASRIVRDELTHTGLYQKSTATMEVDQGREEKKMIDISKQGLGQKKLKPYVLAGGGATKSGMPKYEKGGGSLTPKKFYSGIPKGGLRASKLRNGRDTTNFHRG